MRLLAFVTVAACLLFASPMRAEDGTLLVLRYDDARLPVDESRVTVVVRRGLDVVARLSSVDGWPEGMGSSDGVARYPAAAAEREGKSTARVLLPEKHASGELRVELEAWRRTPLGTPLGLPTYDQLRSEQRSFALGASAPQVLELDLGTITQIIQVSVLRVSPPVFPEGHPVAAPLFTIHQRNSVRPLVPYTGGMAGADHAFPEPDGSWTIYLRGSGAHYLGCYGLGYGEVRSEGIVIKPDEKDRTRVIQVPPLEMEPLCWAILHLDLDSAAPLERCLGVELSMRPKLLAKDPLQVRAHLEELRLRRLYVLRPTHTRWILGTDADELPLPANAPYGMSGNSWAIALATLDSLKEQVQSRQESRVEVSPGRSSEANPDEPAYVASLKRQVLPVGAGGDPTHATTFVFVGTASVLEKLPLLLSAEVMARGALAPRSAPDDWRPDPDFLARAKATAVQQTISEPGIQLRPHCVTTVRVLVDLDRAGTKAALETEANVGAPHVIPPLVARLAPPAVTLERELSLPPSTEPSLARVHFDFEQPIVGSTAVVDVGPSIHPLDRPALVRLDETGMRLTVTYELWPLPDGLERTLRLRPGVQPAARDVLALQREHIWRVQGDRVLPFE